MRERPIPFTAPMVRASLEDRKTMTRRAVKPQPSGPGQIGHFGSGMPFLRRAGNVPLCCPYGRPGDQLWVREAWRVPASLDDLSGKQIAEKCLVAGYRKPWCPIQYEADQHRNSGKDWREFGSTPGETKPGRYRHARFMPRWASRITLEVTGVRIERLHDISETDAIAEGVERWAVGDDGWRDYMLTPEEEAVAGIPPMTAKQSFKTLWQSINDTGSWGANPWVWAISFKRLLVAAPTTEVQS